eukprot:11330987-Alexandrium_andersonii.AAC.1
MPWWHRGGAGPPGAGRQCRPGHGGPACAPSGGGRGPGTEQPCPPVEADGPAGHGTMQAGRH